MDRDRSVTAHFAWQPTCYGLTTSVNPSGSGSISVDPQPNCGGGRYQAGTQVQLTASPYDDYSFDYWSGDASGSPNPVTIITDRDKEVTGHFVRLPPGKPYTGLLPGVLGSYRPFFEGTWEREPNNSADEANGPLRSGKAYQGYPNDKKDYFSVETGSRGRITVDLGNHTGQHVQLQLFYQSTANRVVLDPEPPYHLEHTGPAGRYYIYINTGAGFSDTTPYTLRVTYP
jgi:hypothetical protein